MKTIEMERRFGGHYHDWREKRINKIISILGKDFFEHKKILEVGCGWGDIGLFFEGLGAKVTYTDGRKKHLDKVRISSPDANIYQIDQDKKWNIDDTFDLIIHTGVLYHLSNWKQDLQCALSHSNLMILETVVANNGSDSYEYNRIENGGWDQAINRKSVRPSAAYIEKFLTTIGYTFTRFDDSDINTNGHRYDWVVDNSFVDRGGGQHRRFWIVKKRNNV